MRPGGVAKKLMIFGQHRGRVRVQIFQYRSQDSATGFLCHLPRFRVLPIDQISHTLHPKSPIGKFAGRKEDEHE